MLDAVAPRFVFFRAACLKNEAEYLYYRLQIDIYHKNRYNNEAISYKGHAMILAPRHDLK